MKEKTFQLLNLSPPKRTWGVRLKETFYLPDLYARYGTQMGAKMKLDGFGIFVNDMGVMVRFYRDILGFEIKEEEETTNVFLEKDGTLFLLFRKSDFEKMTNRSYSYIKGELNGHYEIALSVENYAEVDREYKRVTEAGAKAVSPPTTHSWGQRACYIADPEGNLIEIGSFCKE